MTTKYLACHSCEVDLAIMDGELDRSVCETCDPEDGPKTVEEVLDND